MARDSKLLTVQASTVAYESPILLAVELLSRKKVRQTLPNPWKCYLGGLLSEETKRFLACPDLWNPWIIEKVKLKSDHEKELEKVVVGLQCFKFVFRDTLDASIPQGRAGCADNGMILFDLGTGNVPNTVVRNKPSVLLVLSKAKPGIFVKATQYLVGLATPAEFLLIGMCCCGSGDGSDPYSEVPFSEVSLRPLPEYSIPSDGNILTREIFYRGFDALVLVAFNLSFEIDMVAHSLCDFGGGEEEKKELQA
ncbi:hypothetical protein Tco_0795289 [Tanacetum coccineum]